MRKSVLFTPSSVVRSLVPKKAVNAIGRIKNRIITHPKFLPAYKTAYGVLPKLVSEGADKKVRKQGMMGGIGAGGASPLEGVQYDPEQLKMGIEIESEHYSDIPTRTKIAKDHLREDPLYYTHLKEMEDKYKKENKDV